MSSPGAQTITVRHDGTERVFEASQQITMGRAPEVTLFVDSPLVSRVHATLRFQSGAWVLADNGSTNGVFVDARRLSQPVSIDRPTQVRLGDAVTGPLLHLVPAAPSARHAATMLAPPSQPQQPQHRPQFPPPSRQQPHVQQPQYVPTSQLPSQPPAPQDNINMTRRADSSMLPPVRKAASTEPVARGDRVPPGGLSIGRTSDNQIVVNDPLASRKHARLISTSEGLVVEDLGSANGTFVNGHRQQRTVLRERDIVTIGNIDFVVAQGTLAHRQKPVAELGLSVHGVGFTVENNKQLLVDVNVQAGRGTLTALIGPSGAGKSTLAKLVAGSTHPSAGVVTFEGHNLHAEYEALRSRIGMVPQDDVLHRQLTVRQALGFAAELRLPPDSTKADRQQVIDGVLKELSLTAHADTRVDRLSGGQRKRASVAMELLTGPSLLILDEPTSGLDPALDRQVMQMLRELADAGRVVIVVTHSVACLDMCDQVVLLAPGGKTAFAGNPGGVGAAMGTADWAEIFAQVAAEPDRAFAAYRSRQAFVPPPPPPAPPRNGNSGAPPQSNATRQFSTLVRRQLRLILADRGYLAFLVILPFILGALSLVVPGSDGFTAGPLIAQPDGSFMRASGGEAQQLLVVLILGACFMGATLTVRDLVGERSIFHRERAVGLLPSAYLLAKIAVFSVTAFLQSAVLVGITFLGKKAPAEGALIPNGAIELYFDIAMTAVCCVVFGLLMSSLAKSNEQVMPMLVVMIMVQLVMAGGLIPVTDRVGLEQISYLFPSRWGYAAGASTVDLRELVLGAQEDALWVHSPGIWIFNIVMVIVITSILAVITWTRLRLKKAQA
ncbi:FHA domain-containing protein [Nocardia mangyaensis]|uniref:FHA domain-containing protein n=1 Tax=Nocardia mangyaensis TaxID=2213200 RepID=UPI0026750636|nr:FHA domain-containing protein [Nocardia mangyaensis]MDO3647240.1 FHA domain-containing protein [Nocardia mangyaensis]